jgi:hypothetical protein
VSARPGDPGPDAGVRTGDGTWRDAWVSALDELELTLEQTERLLAGDLPEEAAGTAWTPPAIEGPLPADMLERARALLGRQRLLVARTQRAITGNRQQRGLVDRMAKAGGRATPRPAYVDLTA